MDYIALGYNIRRKRKKLHMTQEQLAAKAGLSMSFIGHIERGTRKASLDTLVDIANTLGCGVDELLCDSIKSLSTYEVSSSVPPKKRAQMREILASVQNSLLAWNELPLGLSEESDESED